MDDAAHSAAAVNSQWVFQTSAGCNGALSLPLSATSPTLILAGSSECCKASYARPFGLMKPKRRLLETQCWQPALPAHTDARSSTSGPQTATPVAPQDKGLSYTAYSRSRWRLSCALRALQPPSAKAAQLHITSHLQPCTALQAAHIQQ